MRTSLLTSLGMLATLAAPLPAQFIRDCDGYVTVLVVPQGFCVLPFASKVGPVRHVVVHPSGAVVAAVRSAPGLVRLRDGDRDGLADEITPFGPGRGGSGLVWDNGWLYFAMDDAVIRYRWPADRDVPDTAAEWIIPNLPAGGGGYAHNAKGISVAHDGTLLVSIGSLTDNCASGTRGAPGQFPCPELETRAGIWRFRPGATGGAPWHGERVATGLRNAMPLVIAPGSGRAFALSHGRDALNRNWGWSTEESANQPAEILVEVTDGADFGWPYCMGYYERGGTRLIPAPEYARVQAPAADCGSKTPPLRTFPGHWAPMALTLDLTALPEGWNEGALIVFHGSRGRSPLPQDGHYILHVKLDASGNPVGEDQIFLRSAGRTGSLRAAGVAIAPTGEVYVTDDDNQRIWAILPRNPTVR